jgi:hypothetical protein
VLGLIPATLLKLIGREARKDIDEVVEDGDAGSDQSKE